MSARPAEPDHHVERAETVTPLELFFDLVFVFAITQVTFLISSDPSWRTLGQGMLVLAVVWWAWVGYAWLTNTIDPESGGARAMLLLAMAAVLVGSLAVPQAFGAHALEFSLAYLAVRIIHIAVYIRASHDGDIGAAVKRLAPGLLSACGLLILASAFDGWPQAALWAAAVALDYGTPAITGVRGFRVEPKHFAERHGLILIIALGESIVAVGVGTGFDLSARAIAIAVLGLVVASSLWWAYFDVVAIVAARALAEARGVERARLARDSYSYLHLPMIAGVELLAVGLREALHQVDSPLPAVVSFMLCGGVALYLLGHIAFRLRNRGTVNRQRLVVAGICLALIPVGTHAHALVTLACLAAVCAGLIAYEAIRFREARARVRTTGAT